MFSHRRRARSSSTPPPPSPSALIAASAVYRPTTPSLAAAAAGTALRAASTSPIPDSQRTGSIPTKRMLQRKGSYSSVVSSPAFEGGANGNGDGGMGRPGLERKGSSGSLVERRFRRGKDIERGGSLRTHHERIRDVVGVRKEKSAVSHGDYSTDEEEHDFGRAAVVYSPSPLRRSPSKSTQSSNTLPSTLRSSPSPSTPKPRHTSSTQPAGSILSRGSLRGSSAPPPRERRNFSSDSEDSPPPATATATVFWRDRSRIQRQSNSISRISDGEYADSVVSFASELESIVEDDVGGNGKEAAPGKKVGGGERGGGGGKRRRKKKKEEGVPERVVEFPDEEDYEGGGGDTPRERNKHLAKQYRDSHSNDGDDEKNRNSVAGSDRRGGRITSPHSSLSHPLLTLHSRARSSSSPPPLAASPLWQTQESQSPLVSPVRLSTPVITTRSKPSGSPTRTHFALNTSSTSSVPQQAMKHHSPPSRSVSPTKSALKRSRSPVAAVTNIQGETPPPSSSTSSSHFPLHSHSEKRKVRVSFSDEDSIASFSNSKPPLIFGGGEDKPGGRSNGSGTTATADTTSERKLPVFGSVRGKYKGGSRRWFARDPEKTHATGDQQERGEGAATATIAGEATGKKSLREHVDHQYHARFTPEVEVIPVDTTTTTTTAGKSSGFVGKGVLRRPPVLSAVLSISPPPSNSSKENLLEGTYNHQSSPIYDAEDSTTTTARGFGTADARTTQQQPIEAHNETEEPKNMENYIPPGTGAVSPVDDGETVTVQREETSEAMVAIPGGWDDSDVDKASSEKTSQGNHLTQQQAARAIDSDSDGNSVYEDAPEDPGWALNAPSVSSLSKAGNAGMAERGLPRTQESVPGTEQPRGTRKLLGLSAVGGRKDNNAHDNSNQPYAQEPMAIAEEKKQKTASPPSPPPPTKNRSLNSTHQKQPLKSALRSSSTPRYTPPPPPARSLSPSSTISSSSFKRHSIQSPRSGMRSTMRGPPEPRRNRSLSPDSIDGGGGRRGGGGRLSKTMRSSLRNDQHHHPPTKSASKFRFGKNTKITPAAGYVSRFADSSDDEDGGSGGDNNAYSSRRNYKSRFADSDSSNGDDAPPPPATTKTKKIQRKGVLRRNTASSIVSETANGLLPPTPPPPPAVKEPRPSFWSRSSSHSNNNNNNNNDNNSDSNRDTDPATPLSPGEVGKNLQKERKADRASVLPALVGGGGKEKKKKFGGLRRLFGLDS